MSALTIQRFQKTKDAFFGRVYIDRTFVCYSMERTDVAIAPGIYRTVKDKSPHLGYVCPHLMVPDRDWAAGGDAGIRIHIANFPWQLEGCIAVGTAIDGDSLDHSKDAFDTLMALLPDEFEVEIIDA